MKIIINRLIIVSLVLSFTSVAQSGGDFNIKKSTTDAGGGQSIGADFVMTSTIGQADASKKISGGAFTLMGGFWSADPIVHEDMMFKDGFEN